MFDQKAYSFLADDNVPDFDGGHAFTVMDAQCSLCAKGARWIARNDTAAEFRIIPVQSAVGHALMIHYGLDPYDPISWLFVENGHAFTSLDATIRVGRRLGGFWHILKVFRILPRAVQNMLYGFVARNRYRFFGRTDLCNLPDPEVQKRLIH